MEEQKSILGNHQMVTSIYLSFAEQQTNQKVCISNPTSTHLLQPALTKDYLISSATIPLTSVEDEKRSLKLI